MGRFCYLGGTGADGHRNLAKGPLSRQQPQHPSFQTSGPVCGQVHPQSPESLLPAPFKFPGSGLQVGQSGDTWVGSTPACLPGSRPFHPSVTCESL